MRGEIIAIGTELIMGGITETNSLFLSTELTRAGIEVGFKTIIGDIEDDIESTLKRALERSPLIITTGGLGLTADDLTRKVVSRLTKRRLVLREDLLEKITRKFESTGREMPRGYSRQALIPSQAFAIENPLGTAPGFIIEHNGSLLISLPGVPSEMEMMYKETVKDFIVKKLEGRGVILIRCVKTFGLPEMSINEAIKDLFKLRDAYIGLLAKPTGVDIRIILRGKKEEEVSSLVGEIEEKARGAIGDYIYGTDDETMESVVGLLLKKMGLTLSVAESCTGGLIGHRLTNVPGSSGYIESSLVTYGNRAKTEVLGVPLETIRDYGSVSAQTASSMAERVREVNRTDLGLAVTGIAGPGGGTPTKPVGLVYTALADGKDTLCRFHHFSGTREEVKLNSSQMALDILRRYLLAGR